MPYPLPEEGPPYTTGLRWFLVAVPDDVAFVRAAMGAYTELASYWKWGHEGREPGRQDAAELWQGAIDATLEALEMGFPDILLGHIDEVEDLLRQITALSGCCGELSHPFADLLTDPWQDGDPVPENIVDAGFASSASDQAGYTDYKCLIANVAVQDLVEKINRLAQLIDESNWVVGGVAAIASILTFVVALPAAATVLTAMALGLVAGAGTAAGVWAWLNGVGKATAESTALALDAVYDELVCAIYQADGPDAATVAVAAVISDATNAAASLALTPVISMVIHALYAGRYDQTDTAAALANAGFTLAQHDCDCLSQEDTTLVGRDYEDNNYPDDWVDDVGPHIRTNTPYSLDPLVYQQASSGRNYWLRFIDDAALNNAEATPTSWRIRLSGWAPSGYAEGITWNAGITGTVEGPATNVIENDTWYVAPAGKRNVLVRSQTGVNMTVTFEVLEA